MLGREYIPIHKFIKPQRLSVCYRTNTSDSLKCKHYFCKFSLPHFKICVVLKLYLLCNYFLCPKKFYTIAYSKSYYTARDRGTTSGSARFENNKMIRVRISRTQNLNWMTINFEKVFYIIRKRIFLIVLLMILPIQVSSKNNYSFITSYL